MGGAGAKYPKRRHVIDGCYPSGDPKRDGVLSFSGNNGPFLCLMMKSGGIR